MIEKNIGKNLSSLLTFLHMFDITESKIITLFEWFCKYVEKIFKTTINRGG